MPPPESVGLHTLDSTLAHALVSGSVQFDHIAVPDSSDTGRRQAGSFLSLRGRDGGYVRNRCRALVDNHP